MVNDEGRREGYLGDLSERGGDRVLGNLLSDNLLGQNLGDVALGLTESDGR